MSKFIFFVGKPYPYAEAINIIRDKGFKVGLFLDENVGLKRPERYDTIVKADFSSQENLIQSIAGQNLDVAGLVCTYENYIVAKAYLADFFKVPSLNVKSAMMSTDKFLMRQAFLEANPEITPAFGLVSSPQEAIKVAKKTGYPLILKPTNLVKSLLVLRCDNEKELIKNFAYAKQNIERLYRSQRIYEGQPRFVLEKYVEGELCSIAAFVDKSGKAHFCEGTASLVNAQAVGRSDNYLYSRVLPGDFSAELKKKLFAVANEGVQALEMTSSPAHVELIYNDKEIKLIEIGARIGGYRPRMYDLSYGQDLIDQEIQLALGKLPNVEGEFKAYCGVYEIFPETEGHFEGIDGLVDKSKFSYYAVKAKSGQMVGPAKNGYKAAIVVIVSHKDKQEFTKLQAMVDAIRVKVK